MLETAIQQGYLLNQPLLTSSQAAQLHTLISQLKENTPSADEKIRRIVRTISLQPSLLAQLKILVGPNILLRNADVFIKQPRTKREIAWHVDTPHPWKHSSSMWNIWIALNETTLRNGALEFCVNSHRHLFSQPIKDKEHLNLSPQQLAELDDYERVHNCMSAGYFSAHSFRTAHRSGANRSMKKRIALVLRLFSAETSQEISECGQAVTLSGHSNHYQDPSSLPITWSVHS